MKRISLFRKVSVVQLMFIVAGIGVLITVCAAEEEDTTPEPVDICSTCFCDNVTPYFILCDRMKQQNLFSEQDWNHTLTVRNISIDVKLDVRFSNNELEEIPKFPPLPIQLLVFSNNKISKIANSAFAELVDLDWLDLSHNELTSKDLPESVFFGKYDNQSYFPLPLQHLNISNNRIHSIDKDLFDHLPHLKTIDLSHNPLAVLSGSSDSAISSLHSLESLSLAFTSIKSIPEGMMHSLLFLKSLDLSGNEFVTVPSEISYTHNLTVLNLDYNKFEILDKDSFTGLEFLEDLSICHNNKLRAIEMETFSPLKNLVKLEVHHNRNLETLSDAAFLNISDPDTPQNWPVKEIHLNDNGLTHIDKALAAWEYIDYIDIQNNPFRCSCRLDWLVTVLVHHIRTETPDLTRELTCSEPLQMKGKSLESLSIEPEIFIRCRTGDYEIDPDVKKVLEKDPYQAAGITILVIGVIMIVIGTSILGVIVVKRRAIANALMAHQQIRYERADTDDIVYSNGRRSSDHKGII